MAALQFNAAGFRKSCVPIALVILLGLTLPEAVATCSLRAGYRGYRRGTNTRRAFRSLGLTLSKVPVPPQCRSERNQLALVAQLLAEAGYAKGKYVVLSERRRFRGRAINHASAVVDGRLLDWVGSGHRRCRIRAIYQIEGNLDAARRKACGFAASIPLSRQPLARERLRNFCALVVSHHGIAPRYRLEFRHVNGRRKRSDTMVEWYPLQLHRQPRADPSTNVRSLLDSVHDSLSTDLTGLHASLVDRRGIPLHGNTLVKGLTRKRPRGRPRRASGP